jgi:hypothetical protein
MSSKCDEAVHLEGMVVVASGASSAVQRWSNLLRTASISFAVARCHYDDESAPIDHAEIWVEQSDVEAARTAIRNGSDQDKSLLW